MKTNQLKCREPQVEGFSEERGVALVTSIFGLLLITLLGLALTFVGKTTLTISTNNQQTTEAFHIADSGITHALSLVRAVPPPQWSNLLVAGDGNPNTGDELSTQPTDPIPGGGVTFGEGGYEVRVKDDAETDGNPSVDTNMRIVMTSRGFGRDGSTATIEAVVAWRTAPAILVGGKLRINGNPKVQGPGGIIHANNTLDFDGNPCASQYFSSAANIQDGSYGHTGAGCSYSSGNILPFEDPIPIPIYKLSTLRPLADFIMGTDGKIYVPGNATPIYDANSTGKWTRANGDIWDWSSGNKTWKLATNTLGDGTYFSDGNLDIPTNPGETGPVPQVTLLAEGYIYTSGNPYLTPKLVHKGIPLTMIAGTDLVISGNPASGRNNYQGRCWAGHQFKFNGNPSIQGQVIVADLADTASPGGNNPVPLVSGFNEMSGNASISFDGIMGGEPTLSSWVEVRN